MPLKVVLTLGNIVQLRIDTPRYSSNYTPGYADVDFGSPKNVKLELQRAK